MLMSDLIAKMIEEMLESEGGELELKRNDLAGKIGCVPSQINYVITSRFTPEKGYIIESRRGGGGYVRITKVKMTRDEYLMHIFHSIGEAIDNASAQAFLNSFFENRIITKREQNIISTASAYCSNGVDRADMLRQIILVLMRYNDKGGNDYEM